MSRPHPPLTAAPDRFSLTPYRLTVTDANLAAFAAGSGDRNPLHGDPNFAADTSYGRPIAHGALVVLAALGALPPDVLARTIGLAADFALPVYPGDACTVHGGVGPDAALLRVHCAGQRVAVVTLRLADPPRPPDPVVTPPGGHPPPGPPLVRSMSEVDTGKSGSLPYQADLSALSTLARQLTGTAVPGSVVETLAWVSWLCGMVMPGRDGVVLEFSADLEAQRPGDGETRWRITEVDRRSGEIRVDATHAARHGGIRVGTRTFIPQVPRPTTRQSVARHLTPSTMLDGQQILLIGGSRGLGAATAGAFAGQGATVWTVYAHGDRPASAVRAEFGADRIVPARCNACDPDQLAALLDRVTRAGDLAGLVLVAAPTVRPLPVHPDATAEAVAYVADSHLMVAHPLAAALPALARSSGWVVAVSADPDCIPAGWGHLRAAKSAIEGYLTHCVIRHRLPAMILRAPRMPTRAGSPLTLLGTVPVERVAAEIVRWALTGPEPGGPPAVLTPGR